MRVVKMRRTRKCPLKTGKRNTKKKGQKGQQAQEESEIER